MISRRKPFISNTIYISFVVQHMYNTFTFYSYYFYCFRFLMNAEHFLPSTSNTVGYPSVNDKLRKMPKPDFLQDASEEVLQRKLTALQHEERALLSLISRLRSHQRTLQLEKVRLDQFYEESIKREMCGATEDKKGGQ